jgi:AcrR family transcriptional regulator
MRIRTEAKRDAIMQAASRVFIEMGYQRASMAEISTRVGGSKATLYGYFPSKEKLFLEVVRSAGEAHLRQAFDELLASTGELDPALCRFGEKFIGFLAQPDVLARHRMVIAEAGQSDIGRLHYEAGPQHGQATIAGWLATQMSAGRLRQADPAVATAHLLAMLQSEIIPRSLLGLKGGATRPRIKLAVARAVAAFLAAYGPPPAKGTTRAG